MLAKRQGKCQSFERRKCLWSRVVGIAFSQDQQEADVVAGQEYKSESGFTFWYPSFLDPPFNSDGYGCL
jgi:hypothetical protein